MKLLDLFCGAGGAAMGYHRAGFDEIVGVDIKPQPRYPFKFIQADAMTFPLEGFDAVHASPPCQAFSDMKTMWNAKKHADLLTPTRERLRQWAGAYVIENVEGAPMNGSQMILCGSMFGLGAGRYQLRRHRLFEMGNFYTISPSCHHKYPVIGIYGDHVRDRRRRGDVPMKIGLPLAKEAMGIDWMNFKELSQAIPPAYTEFIGRKLLERLKAVA